MMTVLGIVVSGLLAATLLIIVAYQDYANSEKLFTSTRQKCPKLQISCHDGGRLANQMNSYASLLAVSDRLTEYSPFITEHTRNELTSLFTGISVAPARRDCQPKASHTLVSLRGPTDMYANFVKAHSENNRTELPAYLLLGWCPFNPNIFHRYRGRVLKAFRFKKELQDEAHTYLTWIRSQSRVSGRSQLVSVHVRRDDYLGHLGRLVDVEFFTRAIAALRDSLGRSGLDPHNLVFITTSDDPTWCKINMPALNELMFFPDDYYTRVRNVSSRRNFDLAVAASCDHAIFDYGTFGFWGAYLQNNRKGSHVVVGDDVGKINCWDVVSMKNASIPNRTFVNAFPSGSGTNNGGSNCQ